MNKMIQELSHRCAKTHILNSYISNKHEHAETYCNDFAS